MSQTDKTIKPDDKFSSKGPRPKTTGKADNARINAEVKKTADQAQLDDEPIRRAAGHSHTH